jgi:alpha-amylase/alpha-mannosidase (GH57 family)
MKNKKLLFLVLQIFIYIITFSKPLNVAIIWHQHQPDYKYNGLYQAPWVRLHSIKDYVDMATIIKKYPNVKININLVPSLINQIDDYVFNNAQDKFLILMEKEEYELTKIDKKFILERSFDINWENVIKKYPYYYTLLKKRGEEDYLINDELINKFTFQELRDLMVWFNLAWFDPDFKKELSYYFNKEKNFSLEDVLYLKEYQQNIMASVIPVHRKLQEQGRIEIMTTPYYHPILPLIYNTDTAKHSYEGIKTGEKFSYPEDATLHVKKAIKSYKEHFGTAPLGMWPAEGSVSKDVVDIFAQNKIKFIATDEEVLEKSLNIHFKRDKNGIPEDVENFYRPYVAKGNYRKINILFRDRVLSDNLGFEYSKMSAKKAVFQIKEYLYNIKAKLPNNKDHLVTIILDGENAWENYENDAKDFFNEFYKLFNEDENLKTVRVSDYLEKCNNFGKIENLWSGSWISADFTTWIGENEENTAWDYLKKARKLIKENKSKLNQKEIREVMELILKAEGSDWFWWYGTDQESSNDIFFDLMFRDTLKKVYNICKVKYPSYLDNPIIETKLAREVKLTKYFMPTIDGKREKIWGKGFQIVNNENRGVMKAGNNGIKSFSYTTFKNNVYGFIELNEPIENEKIKIYADGREIPLNKTIFKKLENNIEFKIKDKISKIAIIASNAQKKFRLPLKSDISIKYSEKENINFFKKYKDQEDDDSGSGNLIYPTNKIFKKGMFDLTAFEVGELKEDYYFAIKLKNCDNVWNSPSGISTAVIDIYIKENNNDIVTKMLPHRNAYTLGEYSYCITVEGWNQEITKIENKKMEKIKALSIKKDEVSEELIIKISKKYINSDLKKAKFLVAIYGQDGMAVNKIRKVTSKSGEWQFGGGIENISSNVIDYLDNGDQHKNLGVKTGKVIIPFVE